MLMLMLMLINVNKMLINVNKMLILTLVNIWIESSKNYSINFTIF